MKKAFFISFFVLLISTYVFSQDLELPKNTSSQTRQCIGCHKQFTPSIVYDWLKSRHAKSTPEEGIKKPDLEKRVSAKSIPDNLSKVVVGCYECHSLNADKHTDNFSHFGNKINIVVSPPD
ncbi:MAG: cytochrome c family protein, partial [Proteobacteria bacterium]|nr:cytochrome c family protein [Pseudomonadota bacterium]